MGLWQRQANKAWQGKALRNRQYSTTDRQVKLAGLSRSGRECGGASRSKGGLGPNLLSPPNLSPLPVSVHTHSLNLQKSNQFSPILFLLLFFSLLFPSLSRLPHPLYCLCPANLSSSSPTPNPYVPFLEGNKGELASCLEAQQSLRMASSDFSNLSPR